MGRARRGGEGRGLDSVGTVRWPRRRGCPPRRRCTARAARVLPSRTLRSRTRRAEPCVAPRCAPSAVRDPRRTAGALPRPRRRVRVRASAFGRGLSACGAPGARDGEHGATGSRCNPRHRRSRSERSSSRESRAEERERDVINETMGMRVGSRTHRAKSSRRSATGTDSPVSEFVTAIGTRSLRARSGSQSRSRIAAWCHRRQTPLREGVREGDEGGDEEEAGPRLKGRRRGSRLAPEVHELPRVQEACNDLQRVLGLEHTRWKGRIAATLHRAAEAAGEVDGGFRRRNRTKARRGVRGGLERKRARGSYWVVSG